MGIYAEYLNQKDFNTLGDERKKQLSRISALRGNSDIFCYASDFPRKQSPRISIEYPDLLSIQDQLSNLKGESLDVIIETPGGSAEVAEDIVKMFRQKYNKVSFIIPGVAKSAGTIMTMAGDEILMEPSSSLGPIDAQVISQGKIFSADAFLEGLECIKQETIETKSLNRAYIPMLSNISPGEIQSCKNAMAFSQKLVSEWLVKYKFKNWSTHSTSGKPVSTIERQKRAEDIAAFLCNHKHWLTHSRSIKIEDLKNVKLIVVDYSLTPDLCDAIQRYYTLMQMTFEMTNIYKIFETPSSQIYKFLIPSGPPPVLPSGTPSKPPTSKQQGEQSGKAMFATVEFSCPNCGTKTQIQANFDNKIPLEPNSHTFPSDNQFTCPNCGVKNDLKALRFQLESQTKRPII